MSILLCLHARTGGNVIIPDPGYPAYAAMAKAWSLKTRCYVLATEAGFVQRAEAVLAETDADTVAVIVNTPHNPTGSVMARTEIARLADALAARGTPLIVDEVYHPLYFGARRRRIVDARSYFTISSSPLLERLAAHAVRERHPILARLDHVARANLAILDTVIAEAAEDIAWERPDGGTTCFPWFIDGRDSRPFCKALADKGVLVAPGDCFGRPSHFRLGFAQQANGFERAAATMNSELMKLGR